MKGGAKVSRWIGLGVLISMLVTGSAFADDRLGPEWFSKIVSLQGKVLIKRLGDTRWQPVQLNETFAAGDQIQVGANSRAGVVLNNDSVVRLDQNTTLMFIEIEKETTFILKLLKGAANFFSRRPRSLKIQTPFVNGVVEGTEFAVQVDEEQTLIDLFEGRILAENAHGSLLLQKGQGVSASEGSAPTSRILVQPRDSVQWAMYYPFVMDAETIQGFPLLEDSKALVEKGNTSDAIHTLEKVDADDRNSSFYLFRAGLLLHVGRVAEAESDIQTALASEPDNAGSLALQSVIAVVQNRPDEAIAFAERAVKRAPLSATTQFAYSYVLQSRFKLPEALDAAKKAVENSPDSGLAWARLAELQLSVGELKRGEEAAQMAVQLNPGVSSAHTTLGYAYLTRIKIDDARDSFQKAIFLDSANPLPRLGLGLAKIRKGDLQEGRAEIEIAAGLDPGRSLVRSYLGKAYFDEKRGPLDEKQLEIAKALDPNDPTPWFYDAIRKQTLNRPVEALQDLQTSIELNDNRAVYRSRLYLDQDLAARSASLGRIYNDLNFEDLALVEGYKSLANDSTNYSAHRLLADSYSVKPRHEIARVSELLQSQLFQPLNLVPLQPQLAETDTAFLENGGPSKLSANEFNPLFTRNRLSLQANGLVASNNTWGDDISINGIYDMVSASVGQFYYQTDGFHENNDYQQKLYDVFFQASPTPKTSLQCEYRNAQVESGDRSQHFYGNYSPNLRSEESVEKIRIGGRHSFSARSEAVASLIFSDVKIEQGDIQAPIVIEGVRKREGFAFELRNDYRSNALSNISGVGYMDEDLESKIDAYLDLPPFFPPTANLDEIADIRKANLYSYFNFRPVSIVELTLGLSTDIVERGEQIDTTEWNPKIGVLWRPLDQTSIRLAVFRVFSTAHRFAQTIEPTNVVGFNQFFDDPYASKVWNYGAGIDQRFSDKIFGGIEFTKRDMEVPQYGDVESEAPYFPWEEDIVDIYFYWTPLNLVSVNCGYRYERIDREERDLGLGFLKAETHSLPLGVDFFHPSGFSMGIKGTYFSQEGEFQESDSLEFSSAEDDFFVVDAIVSYRFPMRYGIFSLGVKNLFDERFNFEDTDPSNPTVSESQTVFGKVTLSF